MKKLLKQLMWRLIRKFGLGSLVLIFHPDSLLKSEGWFQSFREGRSVDAQNKPIPWCTYSFIHFIENKLRSNFRVFEYGAGNSTIWYSKRVKEVIAVEDNVKWSEELNAGLPKNSRVIYKDLNNGYVEEIINHGMFDIVVIDGRNRTECANQALKALIDDGVIIWDNSDRKDFSESYHTLKSYGFREIAFCGLSPVNFYRTQTSILYKKNNCLGI